MTIAIYAAAAALGVVCIFLFVLAVQRLLARQEEVIETMLDFFEHRPSGAMAVIDQYGGAVARVPDDATAFSHRHAAYDLIVLGIWSDPAQTEEHTEWARGLWSALEPHHQNVYVNFLMEEGEERIRQAYGAEKYDRLKALKRKYDPDNFFRLNQNIPPK